MTNGTQTLGLERRLSANPSSPLFARLAEALLKNGETSRAERLCEKGLGFHPNYSTGRLILARCLAARGEYGKALESLDGLAVYYPGNILLAELGDEWRSRLAEGPGPEADDAAVFTELPAELHTAEILQAEPMEAESMVAEPIPTEPIRTEPAVREPLEPGPALEEPTAAVSPPAPPSPGEFTSAGTTGEQPMSGIPPDSGLLSYPQTPPAPDFRPSPDVHPVRDIHPAAEGRPSDGLPPVSGHSPADAGPVMEIPVIPLTTEEEVPAGAGDELIGTGLTQAGSAEIPEAPPPGLLESDDAGAPPPMPVPSTHAAPVPILQPVPRPWKGPGFIEAGRIVSRTLAEIYASQGAIGEAVETYRILLNRKPEMREELEARLRQLEERLRTDQAPGRSPGNAKAPA